MPSVPSDESLQVLLKAAYDGDGEAYDHLLHHAVERLRRLARKMLRGWPDLRR
jgi:hypothetical protein